MCHGDYARSLATVHAPPSGGALGWLASADQGYGCGCVPFAKNTPMLVQRRGACGGARDAGPGTGVLLAHPSAAVLCCAVLQRTTRTDCRALGLAGASHTVGE